MINFTNFNIMKKIVDKICSYKMFLGNNFIFVYLNLSCKYDEAVHLGEE